MLCYLEGWTTNYTKGVCGSKVHFKINVCNIWINYKFAGGHATESTAVSQVVHLLVLA